jgi:hypothetical protein
VGGTIGCGTEEDFVGALSALRELPTAYEGEVDYNPQPKASYAKGLKEGGRHGIRTVLVANKWALRALKKTNLLLTPPLLPAAQ